MPAVKAIKIRSLKRNPWTGFSKKVPSRLKRDGTYNWFSIHESDLVVTACRILISLPEQSFDSGLSEIKGLIFH